MGLNITVLVLNVKYEAASMTKSPFLQFMWSLTLINTSQSLETKVTDLRP